MVRVFPLHARLLALIPVTCCPVPMAVSSQDLSLNVRGCSSALCCRQRDEGSLTFDNVMTRTTLTD